jgi:methionyl-tRNA formyltransferase
VEPLKTVFMGTSDFAVPSLRALVPELFDVRCVVTQPDRPAGRGLKDRPSPVKTECLERGLTLLQPERVRAPEVLERLSALCPDLLVVAAYGQILPQALLDLPRRACLNVHASLLPRHRGAAPIHRAILEGDRETGVSIMYMSLKLDVGDVLLSRSTPIGPDEDAGALHDRLAVLGAEALVEAVTLLVEGRAPRIPQDPARATYAPALKREHCLLDWTRKARVLHDQVRGLSPWPVAETRFHSEPLRVFRGRPAGGTGPPGTVLSVSGEGIEVAAGDGSLVLLEVQPPGRRRMAARDFASGHPDVRPGSVFA